MRFKPCPPDPALQELIRRSIARFEAMSPEEQAQMRRAQRKSWVKGNMLLDHPEMTEEQFEAIWQKVAQ